MDRPGGAVGIVVVSVSAQNPSPATCSETRTPKALREALEASMAYSCPVLTSSSKEYVQAKTDRWEERKTRPRRTLTDGIGIWKLYTSATIMKVFACMDVSAQVLAAIKIFLRKQHEKLSSLSAYNVHSLQI